jgi:glycosyltransferase involved in cell wall biosynthesis
VTDPTIAVVIPVHNKERHVVRSLEAAQGQTSPADEIIMVDDASSDRSIERLRAAAGDRAIFLTRTEPGPGGYAARNLAIETAGSEWIAFLDADDSWTPDHLASIRAAISAGGKDVGCVFTGYQFLEPSGRQVEDWFTHAGHKAGVYDTAQMLDFWLEGGCPLWTGAVAIRRDILLSVGMFPAGLCRRGGDRDLWLRTMLATRCAYTGRKTATYHRDADNMLTKVERFTARQRIVDTIVDRVPTVDTGIARRLRRIANREMHKYAFNTWKTGERPSAISIEDFSPRDSLGKYVAVKLMSLTPLPLPALARKSVRILKIMRRGHR